MRYSRLQLIAVAIMALVLGYLIGTWRNGVHVDRGRADTTAVGGGSISTDGWTYGFPAEIQWIDALGTWDEDGPPHCLPPSSSVEDVTFAWVEATIEGRTWRAVLWIDCRGVPPPSEPPAAPLEFRTADPPGPKPSDAACVGVGSEGTIHGDQDADEVLVWLESSRGTQVAAVWPHGFSARFNPQLQLVDDNGVVVAEEGDMLELGGWSDPVYSNLFVIQEVNGVGYPCW